MGHTARQPAFTGFFRPIQPYNLAGLNQGIEHLFTNNIGTGNFLSGFGNAPSGGDGRHFRPIKISFAECLRMPLVGRGELDGHGSCAGKLLLNSGQEWFILLEYFRHNNVHSLPGGHSDIGGMQSVQPSGAGQWNRIGENADPGRLVPRFMHFFKSRAFIRHEQNIIFHFVGEVVLKKQTGFRINRKPAQELCFAMAHQAEKGPQFSKNSVWD